MTYFSLVQRNRGHKGEAGWRETNKTTPEETSSGYGGQEATLFVRLSTTFIVQPNKPSWVYGSQSRSVPLLKVSACSLASGGQLVVAYNCLGVALYINT